MSATGTPGSEPAFTGKGLLSKDVEAVAQFFLDDALQLLSGFDSHPEHTVHKSRTNLKRLRSLLRLVSSNLKRADVAREARSYRDTARLLGDARNANVALETFRSLQHGLEGSQLDAWNAASAWATQTCDQQLKLAYAQHPERSAHQALLDAKGRVTDWSSAVTSWQGLVGEFYLDYRRARRAYRQVRKDFNLELFHDWRKLTKRHLYELRMLRSLLPKRLVRRIGRVDDLASLLGELNDLHLLEHVLLERPFIQAASSLGSGVGPVLDESADDVVERPPADAIASLHAVILQRQQDTSARALSLGAELYEVKPRDVRRLLAKTAIGK